MGNLIIGGGHPVRIQTMTTTDTMDTLATVEQSIRCIEAGAKLIRITAPSKNEAENLLNIKNELRQRGYDTAIVADIHFTPNAAEIAARIVEKVRINPGNYVDKKKFEQLEYTDEEYAEEIERIRDRFTPLIKICKDHGTAMRIGTNHGSLSDRIMSRYGDTANGMVESAMEFLRIARSEDYHNIILSMKSSNPLVMVQAYRLLINHMMNEFGECYPLHLGVTEAGDGEDGRIKSAVGIGTLLEDGIGDTIRVSLTEDPELELPVCEELVNRYVSRYQPTAADNAPGTIRLPYSPFEYKRRDTLEINNIGGRHVPVVMADFSGLKLISPEAMRQIGYHYDATTDKWNIGDAAPDFIFTNDALTFDLPGTLKNVLPYREWIHADKKYQSIPLLSITDYMGAEYEKSSLLHFIAIDCDQLPREIEIFLQQVKNDPKAVLCLSSTAENSVQVIRKMFVLLLDQGIKNPAVITCSAPNTSVEKNLVHYAVETGALLIDGFGDGIWLRNNIGEQQTSQLKLINSIAFGILQATRTRISRTEYISCPSCGRTLFDLQETTARIRAVTNHLKGVKIAIMGCIVNGPGEMADADFGYVGSGVGKITLYRGREVVKRNVNSAVAVDELINLLKESEAWVDAPVPA